MIRPSLILIIVFAIAVAGNAQNAGALNPLVKARYQVSERMYADALTILEGKQWSGADREAAALALGKALSGLKRYEDSNSWLVQVSGDGAAEANYLLAKNYLALNDFASTIQYLSKHLADRNHYPEKQIKLDPDLSKMENNRDWVHLWQKEWYSSAEQQAAECEYLITQGQLDEASVQAGQVLATSPNEPDFLFLQARIYFLQKSDRLFRQSLERAWQLAGEDRSLQDDMLRFALEAAFYEKVNAMAGELIRKDPSNPEYLITRALVRILDGQGSVALKEIDGIEEAGIAPAELYYQAGRKMSSTLPVQAELYLTKAISTGIMDARFYYSRGTVRIALDKAGPALEDMGMSLDINPVQPDLYFDRAQVRFNLGDTEGACHDWKKAVEMGNAKAVDQLYKHCRLP